MATGGHKDSSEEDVTSGEEDWTQYTEDEELFDNEFFDDDTAKKLQQLDLTAVDDQPGTSSKLQGKTIDTGTSETTQHTAPAPPPIKRTPRIESTPLSMQFVKKLLVREHGVKEQEAQAAVQSQGCDIEMCLQWIERNGFNFALLEEKSKQYEYSCGMITEHDMRKWAVNWLIKRFSVVPEVAKAAVQSKGLRAFGDCKRFALSADRKSGDVLGLAEEYDETLNDYQKTEILKEDKEQSTVTTVHWDMPVDATIHRHRMESFGIKGELLYSSLHVARGMAGFDTFFEWVLRNQHDKKKLDINVLHSGFRRGKSKKPSGLNFYLIKGQRYLASYILSDFMPEMVAMAATVQACHPGHIDLDECRKWAEENKDEEDWLQRFKTRLHLVDSLMHDPRWKIFHLDDTDLACKIAESSMIATSSTDKPECLEWIEESKKKASEERKIVTQLISCMFNTLAPAFKYGLCEFEDVVVHVTQMKDDHWLHNESDDEEYTWLDKGKSLFGESGYGVRHVPEMRVDQCFYDVSYDEEYTWLEKAKSLFECTLDRWCEMFSMAAIEATSSTDFDTCRTWITRNAANRKEVLRLYQQYKNRKAGLANDRFHAMAYDRFHEIWDDYDFISIMGPSKRSTAGKLHTHQDDQEGRKEEGVTIRDPGYDLAVFEVTGPEQTAGDGAPFAQESFKTLKPVEEMKTMPATNTEKHEQEPEAACPSRDPDDFLRISELKAEKVQKMGPVGGEINLEQCSLLFPEGAVKKEKKFHVTLTHNPKKFPSFSIPITSILGCRPSMEFDKPVTVKMRTCYSAIGNAEITASLYQREDEGAEWVEVQKVTLTSNNQVQFDVMHFSDDMVGVSDDAGSQGEYHLINNVYIEKGTGRIASMFFVDQGAHDLATEDMRKRGIVTMLMKSKKIIAKMGTEINVAMECRRPDVSAVTTDNPQLLKVTPQFLKKREHQIYYVFDQIPENFSGNISIRYTLRIQDEEEKIPLMISWPISLPEQQVQMNIGNMSIGSRTRIQGEIVSTGESTTTIIK